MNTNLLKLEHSMEFISKAMDEIGEVINSIQNEDIEGDLDAIYYKAEKIYGSIDDVIQKVKVRDLASA